MFCEVSKIYSYSQENIILCKGDNSVVELIRSFCLSESCTFDLPSPFSLSQTVLARSRQKCTAMFKHCWPAAMFKRQVTLLRMIYCTALHRACLIWFPFLWWDWQAVCRPGWLRDACAWLISWRTPRHLFWTAVATNWDGRWTLLSVTSHCTAPSLFCVHVWRQEEVLNVDGVQFIGQCQNACQWQEMPKLWDKGLRQKVCFLALINLKWFEWIKSTLHPGLVHQIDFHLWISLYFLCSKSFYYVSILPIWFTLLTTSVNPVTVHLIILTQPLSIVVAEWPGASEPGAVGNYHATGAK